MPEVIASPKTKVVTLTPEIKARLAELEASAHEYHEKGRKFESERRELLKELVKANGGNPQGDYRLDFEGDHILMPVGKPAAYETNE